MLLLQYPFSISDFGSSSLLRSTFAKFPWQLGVAAWLADVLAIRILRRHDVCDSQGLSWKGRRNLSPPRLSAPGAGSMIGGWSGHLGSRDRLLRMTKQQVKRSLCPWPCGAAVSDLQCFLPVNTYVKERNFHLVLSQAWIIWGLDTGSVSFLPV